MRKLEAYRLIERQRFDLVISDIGVPDEDSFSLLARIRALSVGQEVPVIALTAYARDAVSAKARDAGIQLHPSKPVEPAALPAAVSEIIGR